MGFFASLDRRRIATALAVLVIAFLCGHVMQNYLADGPGVATIDSGPDAAPVLRRGESPRPLPTPPAATLTPILNAPPLMPDRAEESVGEETEARAECDPVLRVEAAPAGTVVVALEAPCHAGERVAVGQGALEAETVVDKHGHMEMRLPALSPRARVTVSLGPKRLIRVVEVPGAEAYQHVAILWNGAQDLKINAYEFGAQRRQFGHVWSGAPKSVARALRGSGGYITRLGDGGGASAEVYSFPAGLTPLRGVVRLVVEAEVTRDNCGRSLSAMALQTGPLGGMSETEVALDLPGCDHLGEIIQLQNLLQDMRLAGR